MFKGDENQTKWRNFVPVIFVCFYGIILEYVALKKKNVIYFRVIRCE